MDNNDFILKIVAELEQKGIKTGFDKLKKELEKDPAKIDVILDTSGTVGKTKGSIKKLAAELHNELSVEINKLQKQGQDINFDLSIGDVEEVIQNVINHTKKLGESFDVASDKAQKFLAKFNKKSGGVLINSEEFKAVQEAINGLGDTHTIEDLNKAMNTLEVTYDNMSSKLRNSGKSLNPFINAKNEMATMDKTIEGISLEFEKLASKPEDVSNAIKELSVQQDKVNSYAVGTMEWADAYGHLQEMIRNVTKDISNLQKAQSAKSLQPQVDKIQLSTDVDTLTTKYQKFGVVSKEVEENLKELKIARETVLSSDSTNTENLSANVEKYNEALKRTKASLTELTTQEVSLSKRTSQMDGMRNWMLKNQAAVKLVGAEVDKLIKECETCDSVRFEGIKREFRELQTQAREAGKLGNSLWGSIKEQFAKFTQWFSVTSLTTNILHSTKKMYESVHDLDTALVDLKKTTDATAQELEDFYYSANDTAKQLGVTTESVISAASAWSRLGYSIKDAQTMAENSAILTSISPDIDSIDKSTDALVSVLKAYSIDAQDSLDGIISKINIIGNTQAVSNGDIVEILTRSSSAMAAANNSLEETIALGTAATEITRNSAEVGTALKTISMRIRGYDEETESYSEDLENLAGTIAELTKTASSPGGISLFTDETKETYKSTYQILNDIQDIWDELTDKNQAELLEALAGKRQGQIVSALISNWEAAESSMNSMVNSAGNAMKEMEVIYDSLDYKLNITKETATGIAQNLFKKEDMKTVVDVLNSFMGVLDKVTEKLGLFKTIGLGAGLFAGVKNFGKVRECVSFKFCFEYALSG